MFSKHVTKDISAYCHGELSPEAARQFAEHIIGCAKCRGEFEEIKQGIKFAEQLPRLEAPESLWKGIEARLGEEPRSEEHTSELQSQSNLVCRLLLEKKKKKRKK